MATSLSTVRRTTSQRIAYGFLVLLSLQLGWSEAVSDGADMPRLVSEDALAVITIWQEARNEPFEGLVAVGEVIRNRMRLKYSSDGTVSGTVLKPLQFSGWNAKDPSRIKSLRIDDDDKTVQKCLAAWELSGTGTNHAKGAVLYYAPAVVGMPDWAKPDVAVKVAEIGGHHFYVPKPNT